MIDISFCRIKQKALFHDGLLSAGKAHKESDVKFAAAVMTVHTMTKPVSGLLFG